MKSYQQISSKQLSTSILIAKRLAGSSLARSSLVILVILAFWAATTLHGAAEELLTNGNFETGNFTGWTVLDNDIPNTEGSYYISTPGTTSPISDSNTAPNPSGGNYYAVSDDSYIGTHVLYQSFTVPAGTTSLTLTFQMFVNNQSDVVATPDTLDYETDPNQQVRVDILNSMADPFTVGSAVVDNLYDGEGTSCLPNPYETYTFDISDLDDAPGTYFLRFAEVDNQNYNQNGIDNVSIVATTAGVSNNVVAVPEPSTWALLLGGLGGVMIWRRLRLRAS